MYVGSAADSSCYDWRLSRRALFLALFAVVLALRLCHIAILWEGDAYPLAAAQQLLHGKMLYRDLWFDKPPLLPAAYLLFGAQPGWPLRLAGAGFVLLACWLAYRLARDLWSEQEGLWAAGLSAFFLTFDVPSSVIPVASDLLMLAPHLVAVWLAWKRRPLAAGMAAGLAFWINPKGVFVAAACVLFDPSGVLWMAAGFAAVSAIAVAGLAAFGTLPAYWDQVWRWGRLYAASPFVESPLRNGIVRTLSWSGFHAALLVAAAWFLREKQRWRWMAWIAIAAIGVAAGWRFFPRYYFLLLAPLVPMAARGFVLLSRKAACAALLLLLIPLVRFGPSYITAARGAEWRDTAMDRDSRAAAAIVKRLAAPGDTLFVWGYRPELYVYTGLPAGTRYLDSQPLSGVPADRHLTQSEPIETVESALRRQELVRAHPTILIDGLGLYNPKLAIGSYHELRAWLADYREIGRTAGTVIYRSSTAPAFPKTP